MGERWHLPIPMWVAQCQLLGGARRVLLIALVCVGVLGIGFFGYARYTIEDPLPVAAGNVLIALPTILGFILILGGCSAVYRTLLRDYTTKMRDSHRLTPMSSTAVVLGYLFGSTVHILTAFTVILGFGGILTVWSGNSLGPWIGGCFLMLHGAMTMWAGTVFLGMRQEKPPSPGVIIICIGIIANVGLVLLPAVGVFASAYAVVVGGSLAIGGGALSPPLAVAAVTIVHFILTFFWIGASAAKYRRPDLPAMQAGRGLVLLTLFTGFGAIGIMIFDLAFSGRSGFDPDIIIFQWCGTLGLSLLVALAPVNGAMECRSLASRGTALRSRWDRVPDLLVALAAPTMVIAIMMSLGWGVWHDILKAGNSHGSDLDFEKHATNVWLLTAASCYAFVLTIRGAVCLCRSWFHSYHVVAALVLLVLWVAIPGSDIIFASTQVKGYNDPLVTGFAFSQSPIGSLVILWTGVEGPVLAGVLSQVVVMIVITILTLLPHFRHK